MKPMTVPQWRKYISGLAGKTLFSQVCAANTIDFARRLKSEGFSMSDVEAIMAAFAAQCRATNVIIPPGGAWDLQMMAMTSDEGLRYTEEEARFLEIEGAPDLTDDLDVFEAEASRA